MRPYCGMRRWIQLSVDRYRELDLAVICDRHVILYLLGDVNGPTVSAADVLDTCHHPPYSNWQIISWEDDGTANFPHV